LPAPGLLVQSTRADGVVRLHNHGSDHVRPHEGESGVADDPLYSRQSYSTVTGPTAKANQADNHLAVVVAGTRSGRRSIRPLGAGGGDDWGWAASWHRPVFSSGAPMVPGMRVESVTVARARYELRVHRVLGAPAGARVEQTGWATGPDDTLTSALHGLHGWGNRDGVRAPQGTAYTRWAVVPRLSADAEGTTVLVALASLTAEPDPGPLDTVVNGVRVNGDTVEVRWAEDGTTTRIGFEPLSVTHG
ncbi:hypothetical protein ACIOG9_13000, partial [Streptomyces sp. NPDC088178]